MFEKNLTAFVEGDEANAEILANFDIDFHCISCKGRITGTAYAGKSTMVKLLSEKHNMIFRGENYHDTVAQVVKTSDRQPASMKLKLWYDKS